VSFCCKDTVLLNWLQWQCTSYQQIDRYSRTEITKRYNDDDINDDDDMMITILVGVIPYRFYQLTKNVITMMIWMIMMMMMMINNDDDINIKIITITMVVIMILIWYMIIMMMMMIMLPHPYFIFYICSESSDKLHDDDVTFIFIHFTIKPKIHDFTKKNLNSQDCKTNKLWKANIQTQNSSEFFFLFFLISKFTHL